MPNDDLHLKLIRSDDDPSLRSEAYQGELRQLDQALRAQGMRVSWVRDLRESTGGGSPNLGELFVQIGPVAASIVVALAGLVGAWLQAKYGRTVRVKIGDVEVEGKTAPEVERLLTKAVELHAKPKRTPSKGGS